MTSQTLNPIIPGFSPDPSLAKVGEWYYLVNSSFHMFPGLPIYASRDLVSWKQIGNAIHRQSQLSLRKADTKFGHTDDTGGVMLVTGGLYAPTIRYHEGTFYVICTNILHVEGEDVPENFIVSTQDIWEGDWGDPVYFDFKGIDPSLLFDNGRVFVQGSAAPGPYTTINLFEIDIKTGNKLSEEKTIWKGTGGIYPEGPHVYKRNGWYYLMISEGGTHEGHMVTMARSQGIWGPYESCPNNPILTARDTDEYIQYTGHCDAFQDDKSQWWGVCLGVRKGKGNKYIMGRETFLTRGNWDGEWLSFENVKSSLSGLGTSSLSAAPGVDFLYIRDPILTNYEFCDSSIVLMASTVDLSSPHVSPTYIGKRQRKLNGQSTVTVSPLSHGSSSVCKAGIALYKDEHRYMGIFYDSSESTVVFELINKAKEIQRVEQHRLDNVHDRLELRIAYTEQAYRLFWKEEGKPDDWAQLADVDTLEMTGPDFVGPVIGIFAVADSEGLKVAFNSLKID
ncbi:putative xylosidase/arabinosidase [Thelonectria olida]|uniref:Xylosidase/arabinosidase n=1 Tax=Thelonectria olida TaxID=1576542 RepID=A0A9P8VRM9_9HYPO|nr:putative xylosidase/arabinosidase [Thelonectria olida]